MIAGRFIVVSLGLMALTPAGLAAQTLSPRKAFDRYQQFIWQDQDGLPQNTVRAIARTRDGYLWLATLEGAVRFDGVRFTVFDSNNTSEIRIGLILAMLEDREGNLWFGTDGGGLVRRTDGRFARYSVEDGLSSDHAQVLLQDRAGHLWIGTDGGGVSVLEDGRFTAYTTRNGLPDDDVWALAEDAYGDVWIGTSRGLVRVHDRQLTIYTARDGLASDLVLALLSDAEGNLWIGTDRGLTSYRDGQFAHISANGASFDERVMTMIQDRDGAIWIGTGSRGVYRMREGRFSSYGTSDGLSGGSIRAIYQDPEGDVWIGTDGKGVTQLRDGGFRTVTTQNGLMNDNARAIYEDSAGRLWIGTSSGVSRLDHHVFTNYSVQHGLPDPLVRSVGEDVSGNLWLGTRGGLARFRDGRFDTWTTQDGLSNNNVFTVLGDRTGNVWIGTLGGGLNRFRDGHFTVYTTKDGLADNDVLSLFEDRGGDLWIGTRSGGVSRFRDGHFTSWSTKDGLANNHVLSFHQEASGALWIGTHGGGLNRFKEGRFSTITAQDGLYDNIAFQILADEHGDLWMIANKGIYRTSLKELNDFADGKTASVTSFSYGVADGMLSREGNGANPGGAKTRDGHLWFPTVAGAVVIDPMRRNVEPPLVAIEGVTIDREAVALGEAIRLTPGQENLEIQYTGLSWSRPQQIKFRYRLSGLDHDWVDAGARRTAYYSHVPPGDYMFQVTADNGEGVWNTTGSSLAIAVLPAFYQTSWFFALAGLAGIAVVAVAWRYRVRQLRQAETAQRAFSRQLISSQESERQRIAAELHDSLGQQLVIIKNLALLSLNGAPHSHARERQIEQISDVASEAIGEVKAISYNLRPYQLDRIGLTKAVEAIVRAAADATAMAVSSQIDDIDSVFPKESEINFYRIVQESLNNVMKHSGATEVNLLIRRSAGRIQLSVEDNGRGFVLGTTVREPGQGGFGLVGMSERAQLLGGTVAIHSTPGRGTTLNVDISLRHQEAADA